MKVQKQSESGSKLALGIALVILGIIFMSGKVRPGVSQSASFANEPVEISGFQVSDNDEAALPIRIVVPQLNIDLSVKPAKLVDGYWEVFLDSAGWGEGSGIPGLPGNQVIFAHAKEGLFRSLKDAEEGMIIYVFAKDKWFEYEISNIKEVNPSQTEVIKPTEEEMLTLYTCSGFADSKRLIVVAKRV